ncbi:tRNA (adenosine(37)-N6)-threonylcarbamoyltransferase complex dimerization subunit type 1 TsaB [Nodosilinea sp. P-1105]|uniref:tRNA (adenosine(37)-N6)-threonylcarbamoyltransferase complex dimerization subunit type 1 TsaB n=1 Tax=Nodosilinea sp. P-1105 TaxID=2546229 RepID=UPI00146EA0E3|nr:tRNA (adenosine(37)-N6)-threonylcarbamoyltransferase complex dimerization subunit type 1 TsaB [Nodosilinea sp. P-1105]NMF82121.1 tRNA (adenosine(37)-N6)-threonylcarbamoyltransferase complex dimerization subunit type 1 TsaB [Nodosilinea sp. P-1105]
MLGLAIHTAGPALGLALCQLQEEPPKASPPTLATLDSRHQTWAFGRDLSAHLHTTLITFIQPHPWTDLAFLAVAQGPGGFTGTRIGVVTARTLAQQLNIPLFGVSTLAAVAQRVVAQPDPAQQQLLHTNPAPDLAVAMRAQRGMLFTGIYRVGANRLPLTPVTSTQPEQVLTLADWEATLAQHPRPLLAVTAGDDLADTVPQVLTLAYARWQAGENSPWSEVLPYYGQHPVEL